MSTRCGHRVISFNSAHHTPSENRSTKSADGRMATEAAWLECKESTGGKRENRKSKQKKRKTHLTHSGLLMEGVDTCIFIGFMNKLWRRGWDSNPRYGFPYARFRGEYFQPLSHLSAVVADSIVAEPYVFRQSGERTLMRWVAWT